MYPGLYNNCLFLISLFLMGLSIKLFDDYIDENRHHNVPYIMCFLCISLFIFKENISLFFCSYMIGMFHEPNMILISKLKAYQEQIIVFTLLLILVGVPDTASSMMIMLAIQLLDDLIDQKADVYSGKKNWAEKYGRVETVIILFILILLSCSIAIFKTIACIVVSLLISFIFNLTDIRLIKNTGVMR